MLCRLFLYLFCTSICTITPQICEEFCTFTAEITVLYRPAIAAEEIKSCMVMLAARSACNFTSGGEKIAEKYCPDRFVLLVAEAFSRKYLNCIDTFRSVVGKSCTARENVCPALAFSGELTPPVDDS